MGKITLSKILEQKPTMIYTAYLPVNNNRNDLRIAYKIVCNGTNKIINSSEELAVVVKGKKIHLIFDGDILFSSMNGFGIIKKYYETRNGIEITPPIFILDYLRINREKLL